LIIDWYLTLSTLKAQQFFMKEDLPVDHLAALKANKESALKAIFQEHYSSLYQIIRRVVYDHAITEDLTQEVFVKLWEKRHKIELQGSLGPYLRRMAFNEALGYLRKQKKMTLEDIEDQYDLATETADAEDIYAHEELKVAVAAAMEKLPARCRMVFSLSRFEGKSYKEIGEEMEISVKTVENQISKALRLMRQYLKPFLPLLLFFFLQ
jgi:RNA polymerase sigma-70 factor (ECF subfamily)